MGKGDKRSLRGKIYKGSYGNARPHRVRAAAYVAPAKPEPPVVKPLGLKK